MQAENASVTIYRDPIPPSVEADMEALYQHRYASSLQMKVYGQMTADTMAYVAARDGKTSTALLFRLEHGKACVLNEQMWLDEGEIARFARYIFATFREVKAISFPVVRTEIQRFPFPHQQFHSTTDIVLTLPHSVEEYMARLGKSTRSYVKRYLNKLRRDCPSFEFRAYANSEIRDADVRDIIALNRARMSGRNKTSYIDEEEERRMLALLKLRGFVGVLTIDGRVCAGTINYRFGDNYFLQVVAHNPAYDDHGLGTLCCYLTICECIAQHGNEYHFLWGQYEYKYRLLGVQRDLDHLAVYRSRLHMLLLLPMALRIAREGYTYSFRSWVLNKARRKDDSSFTSTLVFHLVNGLRDLKNVASRMLRREHAVVAGLPPAQGSDK
ncbi:MAG TPA: GNAT family N-acetyltransferase [Noviherbaspirillum sp.]|uniref:GNAT family N-acetyltransferase n=1 Tax=Noviherbaspirillum sp. TaxID=1926288 RepID=UPI002B459E4E|nr:GNAT family N-acetyltransferase [Noviherbaspirillum sp.]HJV86237.1 GNAT family N-acetyltransferase [Noviherbaspirillum sp.]